MAGQSEAQGSAWPCEWHPTRRAGSWDGALYLWDPRLRPGSVEVEGSCRTPGRPSAASEGGEPPHAPRNSGRELAHPAKYQLRVLKRVVRLLENTSTAFLSSLKLHCPVVIRVAELNLSHFFKKGSHSGVIAYYPEWLVRTCEPNNFSEAQ